MNEAQTFGVVLKAEFARFFKRKRTIFWLAIFAVAAIAVTAGVVSFGDFAQKELETAESLPFVGYGLAHSLLAFTIGILCSSAVAGEYADGVMGSSLLVVPRRGRFMGAQLAVWMVVAFVVTLLVCGALAAMYSGRFADMAQALLGLVLVPVAVCATTLVAYACASISRRGSVSVLLFIGIVLLLPMVFNFATSFIPGDAGQALAYASSLLPGGAGDNMSDAAILFSDVGKWTASFVASIVWAAASVIGSKALFDRFTGTAG